MSDFAGQASSKLRLRRLTLEGFKSFADKTVFDFDRPVTAIVGPNGCGKSNVVDAVKWVLGEQSAKTLRGGVMADVLFNGTDDRPAAESAEVTLLFDNPADADGQRPLAIDRDEVTVGRVLLRDGTSHYLLAGRRCRLKDIRDAFVDTGVGQASYCVIEQGRVARMLEADPAERRLLFEEAAGVGRFREQRKEADRRLDKSLVNLARLDDVTAEIDRQVRGARNAATRARTYRELTSRQSEIVLRLARHRYRRLATEAEAALDARNEAVESLAAAEEQLTASSTEQTALRTAFDDAEAARRSLELDRVRAEAARREAEQRLTFARERHADAERRLADAHAERDRLAIDAAGETSADGDAAPPVDAQLEADHASAAARLADREADAKSSRADAERAATAVRELVLQRDTLASTVARLTATLEARSAADASRASRLTEAETELDDAQKASADARARLATHVDDVDEASASVDVCETTLASVEERVTNVAERLGELTQERDDLERERAAYVARREALDAVERRRDGVGDATRELLADEARKLVADCVTVDAEWASAVEAAAADRLEAVIVADVASLEVDGPVHVVSHDTIAATERAGRPAAEVIRPRSAADSAVAVWLAHDLRLVDQLPAEPTPGVTFATRDGRVLRGDGLLRLGPVGSGSLARRAELDQLVDDLDQLDGQLAQRRETLDTVELDHAAVSRERDGAADALAAARESFASATQERDALDRESARLTAAVSQSQRRVDVLRQEATDVQSSTDALQRELDQATEEASAVDASLATARDTAAEATHGVEQAVTTMSDTRLHLARLDERRRAVQAAAQASRDRREAIERQREAIAQRRVQLTSLIVELEAAVEQAKAVVDEANADLSAAPNPSELDASLAERTHQTNAAREAAANAELRHRQAEDAVRQARDAQSRRDRDATAAELRLETHVTRSFEEHDLSTEDLAAEVEALLVEEPKDDAELIELRGRIARLGPVDPDADTKLAEIEARQVDVADQARDVRQAVAELRRLIAGLDEERDKRFAETFEAVKGHFGGLFRKLFGGGRAELSLTEPAEDDDTPPGVEVTASPPGKRPVRMSQLSGGEKSMASVALLMSLFRARPGPFCILDEVDAALDEANTQRFCHLLDDFIGETQFVVVTHAKPTMRSADVLFGVTMPDRGISRRVEVRFGPKDEVVTDAGVLELA